MDDDVDGDGIPNEDELGLPLDTSSTNPDSDGDGVCDGPEAPANGGCVAGPDAFPLTRPVPRTPTATASPTSWCPAWPRRASPRWWRTWTTTTIRGRTLTSLLAVLRARWTLRACLPIRTATASAMRLTRTLTSRSRWSIPTQYVDLFVNRTMEPLIPFINGSGEVVRGNSKANCPRA